MKNLTEGPGTGPSPSGSRDYDLVIFDWDGTLVDSRQVIVDTMRAALEEVGREPLAPQEMQQVIGLGLYEAIRSLVPEACEEECERIRVAYGELFKEIPAGAMPFFPGVENGLEALKARGQWLAVATGKSRRGLDRVLGELGMEGYFHGTRCADETASKPDPRMLEELLTEFGVPAERAIFVGDTAFDMEMAHRLGMPRIAATYGVHAPERLAPWRPQGWAGDFREALGHLGFRNLAGHPAQSYN